MAARDMSYADYLHLDKVLNAQAPLSDAHDEVLFIIQHQTSELWMKLAIHEMRAARQALTCDDFRPCFKMFARVSRIFEQLNSAWDVLRTMTPSEYTRFRGQLGGSSGFQSHQYREIEFLAGNKNAAMIRSHERDPAVRHRLETALAEPSLYDEVIKLLARSGFAIPDKLVDRDWREPHRSDDAVRAAWCEIYRQTDRHWSLYELAEKLIDFEDYFRRWRFNHVTTVERIIGAKRGTGGTAGVPYLRRMLEVVLFPELWEMRTDL
ncbi:MAG: tryptophan 2,3-dioxygenase [Geminicoccaceae bacterium]